MVYVLKNKPTLAYSDKWVKSKSDFWRPLFCLVGKYKGFGEKISALAGRKKPKPFRARFENAMGNPIFNLFFSVGQNATIFFLQLKYGPSHFKTAFKINFGLWEVVKL